MTLQAYEGSLPGLPDIGKALSGISVDFMVPKLGAPGDDDDDEGNSHFIKDATVLPLSFPYIIDILVNIILTVTSLVVDSCFHSSISSPPLNSIRRQNRRNSVLQPHGTNRANRL